MMSQWEELERRWHKEFTPEKSSNDIWTSHHARCLALHEEAGFNKKKFPNEKDLWNVVFQFLEQGYRVQ